MNFKLHIFSRRDGWCAVLLMALLGVAFSARAQTTQATTEATTQAETSFAAWQRTMDEFAAADLRRRPDSNGVLFVGSSTIRLWRDLAENFRDQPVVINRGFGGSTLADCEHFARQLVLQYRPAQVLIYAGDNDLAMGRSPAQIMETFARFTATIRAELPRTRIAYISIKPSPARAALMPAIRETNALIAAHLRQLENADYIDTHTAMLTPDGQPRAELFLPDRLHMNASGYTLWQSVIAPYLAASAVVTPGRAQSATMPPR